MTDDTGPAVPPDIKAFNAALVEEYRANAGKLGGRLEGHTLMLLTTTGAKSGLPRTVPLGFVADGSEDRLVIFASNIGAPAHPDWYVNLVANPDVTVELRHERFTARASTTEGTEHDRLYELFTSQRPGTDTHQGKTERKIPIVLLERTN